MGNTAGGSGNVGVSGGTLIVGGGIADGYINLYNGAITVLDQNPPAGEDPELNRAIVGGYMQSSSVNVGGGTLTTPVMKLGITSGLTGGLFQDGGMINVGVLGVGNDTSLTSGAGTGTVLMYYGSLNAGTILIGSSAGGVGTLTVSGNSALTAGVINCAGNSAIDVSGPVTVTAGTLNASAASSLQFTSGTVTINSGAFYTPTGGTTIGDGYSTATLLLHNSSVFGSLSIEPYSTLAGRRGNFAQRDVVGRRHDRQDHSNVWPNALDRQHRPFDPADDHR